MRNPLAEEKNSDKQIIFRRKNISTSIQAYKKSKKKLLIM